MESVEVLLPAPPSQSWEGGAVSVGEVVEDTDGLRVLICDEHPMPDQVWERASALGVVWALRADRRLFAPLRSSEWVPVPPEVRTFVSFDSLWDAAHPAPPRDAFVNVHTHTEVSALDGLTTISELTETVSALGQEAVAVTDHGTCANHPDLLAAAPKAGLRPICGLEAYWVPNRRERDRYNHLILWALDPTGLRNLWGLSTEAQRSGFYGVGRCDWELLERYGEGLAVSTACLRGPVADAIVRDDEEAARAWLARAQQIFDGRLWVELHTNHLPEQMKANPVMVDLARSLSLPLIAAADSHYATEADRPTHRLWMLARAGKESGTDDAELFRSSHSYHLLGSAAVREALSYLPRAAVDEAIAQTVVLASSCEVESPVKASAPLFDAAKGRRYATERLEAVCEANWEAKITSRLPQLPVQLRHPESEYRERYRYEMELLGSKDFHDYFMIVHDYVAYAKSHRIFCGPGRGSGVASLVAYLADITEIDPVAYRLLFARFLTPGRVKPPDFDLDFPTSSASQIHRYVVERWGEGNVARIGSVLRMRNRAAIKAARRMLVEGGADISFVQTENLCKLVEAVEADSAGLGKSWEEVAVELGPLLDSYRETYPEVIDLASKIVGRISSYGKHASGLVISTDVGSGDLFSRLPMRRGDDLVEPDPDGDPGAAQMVTDLDYRVLESWGFLKFDFLFLRTLDTVQNCLDLILARRGQRIWPYEWTKELDDPQVWEAISDGQTLGGFQIETPGMTRLIRRFRPSSITELADVITLVRPGPSRSGITETYLRRRSGSELVTFLHSDLEPILADTQGTMIYQEQVMQICSRIGGYDDVQADTIREILGKKLRSRVGPAGREFIAAAQAQGYSYELASILWNQMEEFALYCVSGETRIHLASSGPHSDGTVTVQEVHHRLHAMTPPYAHAGVSSGKVGRPRSPFDGPCVCCGASAEQYVRGYCVNKCYAWLQKFRGKGLYALALHSDGRIRPSRILDVIQSGEQQLWKITLANGMTIRATEGHRHLTPNGYVPVCALSEGDRLMVDAGYQPPTPEEVSSRSRLSTGAPQRKGAVHGAFGPDNYAYIDGGGAFHREWRRVHPPVCLQCGATPLVATLQVAHLDGNHQNNVDENLAWLCQSCHLVYDYRVNGRRHRWEKGHLADSSPIVSIEADGVEMTYDVVMDEPHNFVANGIVTHNSFNRAHAVGYAFLAYYCAWLRVHYPEEFFAAVLSTLKGPAKNRVPQFVTEFQKLGYSVRLPDVNLSEVDFSAEDMAVRYGLGQLKGVGDAVANTIVANRPYASVGEFLEKMKGTKVGSGHVRILASVGAFDSLEPNRKALEYRLEAARSGEDSKCVHVSTTLNASGVACGFDWSSEPVTFTAKGKPKKRSPPPKRCTKACRQYSPVGFDQGGIVPYTKAEIREIELAVLGVWVSSTPFDGIPESLWPELIRGSELQSLVPGRYYLPGVLRKVRSHTDRSGRPMAFLSVVAADAEVDIVAFSKVFAASKALLRPGVLALYELDTSLRDGEVSVLLHALRPLVIPEGVSSATYTPVLMDYSLGPARVPLHLIRLQPMGELKE